MKNELNILIEKANNNDIESLIKLGSYYEEGINVEQSYEKAFKYYKIAADLNSEEACNYVGLFYQDGIGIEKNYDEAFKYFDKSMKLGSKSAANNIAYLYLNGLGVKRDFKKSLMLFKKSNCKDKYLLDILKKIDNGSNVVQLNNLKEIDNYSLKDDDVLILNTDHNVNYCNFYDYKTLDKITSKINKIILNIDLNKNEEEIFIEIYYKLVKLLKYDHDAYDYKNFYEYAIENATTTRNLVGLLKEKCVCGGHAKILKNILLFLNIDSRELISYDHSFNKVKINNKWFYCDITKDILNYEKGQNIENYLKTKNEFVNCLSHIAFNDYDDIIKNK